MTRVMSKKEQAAFDRQHHRRAMQENFEANRTRARALTVGTAFGGTTDIMMRRNDGEIIWTHLQPVEVVELIHQLAAGIGCHIHIQPRKDFASWRGWQYSEEELTHFRGVNAPMGNGHPPHAKEDGDPEQYKTSLPSPEQQPGLQPAMMARSESNEQTVATQKTVGRKRAKRAATPA